MAGRARIFRQFSMEFRWGGGDVFEVDYEGSVGCSGEVGVSCAYSCSKSVVGVDASG